MLYRIQLFSVKPQHESAINDGFVPKNGTKEAQEIHKKPLEGGPGRLSISGYLIIILEESDTKLILQRAVCHTIRLMPHFCDKHFVTLPYFPVGKLLGNKSYRHTSFQKKKKNQYNVPITIHKKKRKSVYNKETFQHEFPITSIKETGRSSETREPRFGEGGRDRRAGKLGGTASHA